jgi:hypothetical protein
MKLLMQLLHRNFFCNFVFIWRAIFLPQPNLALPARVVDRYVVESELLHDTVPVCVLCVLFTCIHGRA